MNKKAIKYALMLLAMFCTAHAHAWDFYSGGIYYRVADDNEVAVAPAMSHNGRSLYEQEVLIVPEQVHYDGITYQVTAIDDQAFVGSSLREAQLPASVTTIGVGAFEGVETLTSITLPLYLESVAPYVLAGTSISAIAVPDGVTRLGQGAFEGCAQLHTVYLPASLVSIGDYAFDDCFNLFEIYCAAELPPRVDVETNFLGVSGVDVILLDDHATAAYDADPAWGSHDTFSLWSNDDINLTLTADDVVYAGTWRRVTLGDFVAYKVYDSDGQLTAITAANAYYAALTQLSQDMVIAATNMMADSDDVLAFDTMDDTRQAPMQEPASVDLDLNLLEPVISAQGSSIYVRSYRPGDWTTVYDAYGRLYYQHPTLEGYIDNLPTGHVYIVVVGETVKKVAL